MISEIISLIEEAAAFLDDCSLQTKANWFRERLSVLLDSSVTESAKRDALAEIRVILVGQGSFSDLPTSRCKTLSEHDARNRLWELTDLLGAAIRKVLDSQPK